MDYEASQAFHGDARKALDVAASVFAGAGFRIDSRTPSSLLASRTALAGSKQDPLCGASRAEVHATGSAISLKADLGEVRKLMKFLTILIGTMAVTLAVILGILVFHRGQPPGVLFSLLAFAPWVVLLPVMNKLFKSRTRRALDTLLHNTIALGGN
jgi:hypothetical protein